MFQSLQMTHAAHVSQCRNQLRAIVEGVHFLLSEVGLLLMHLCDQFLVLCPEQYSHYSSYGDCGGGGVGW